MSRRADRLTPAEARRVALTAQGFGAPRPARAVGVRDVQSVVNRLGQFQIDSVNVVTRAHYLPLFSRLGPYDPALLERAAHRPPRRLFEYWGHAASLLDVRLHPLLRFRMLAQGRPWPIQQSELVDWVLEQVVQRGPLTARQIEHEEERRRTHWGWNWSSVKTALEWLFDRGDVTAASRNSQFERVYDLTERVLPPAIVSLPTPSADESVRALIRVAARALGVSTDRDLRDYFRTRGPTTDAAIRDLVSEGELVPVEVPGWTAKAYLWHEARIPRAASTASVASLVSPFDSLVFERSRLEGLFDFLYRIEIYVPEAKRLHGYYVYPFVLGDRFVARVDLKADRAAGRLRVNGAWAEPGHASTDVAAAIARELTTMAGWLGLREVEVGAKGDLAPLLHPALG